MAFDLLEQVESSLTINKVSIQEFSESDQFCDKPLYPRQLVLLKLIFLEELERARRGHPRLLDCRRSRRRRDFHQPEHP
jgi:hypothetical protein